MDYKVHYNKLIDRARTRLLESYCERHHVLPRCLGGGDEETNLVSLTGREHYIAHQLLVKMYPGNAKLVYAAKMMTINSSGGRIGNRLYAWLREQFSKTHSESMIGNSFSKGHISPVKGKTGVWSEKSNQQRSLALKGISPTEESNHKRSKSMKGKNTYPKSAEHRRKLSEGRKGKPWTAARRAAQNAKKQAANIR